MAEVEESVTRHDGTPDPGSANKIGCGLLGRYPVISIVVFACLGLICGYGLSLWVPAEGDEAAKKATLQWLGLIGDLFIRLLTCFVLPLVFVTVALSVVDMLSVGKASTIGWRVIIFYIFTTLCAALVGIMSAAIFSTVFKTESVPGSERLPEVQLGCNTMGYITEASDGSLYCTESTDKSSTFMMKDINGYFVVNTEGIPQDDVSLSDQLYEGVFMKLFTNNIFYALTDGNFAAVVIFAIIFGAALGKEMTNKDEQGGRTMEHIINVMGDADHVFVKMLTWVISATPFAVWSLITAAVGAQENLATMFANVGLMIVAIIFGYTCQFCLVYCGAQAFLTKSNPFTYLKQIFPAQTMALASASSAATLPITMNCIDSTGLVPEPVWRFILPLGATINMDGMAVYLVVACVWLAILNGLTVDFGDYVLLAILATVGSAGAAPVPQSGLVLILTSYNTTFNTTGTPNGFEYIIAVDWFIDRMSTCMNVTSDSVVCRMVAATSNIDDVKSSVLDSIKQSYVPAGLTESMVLAQQKNLDLVDKEHEAGSSTPPDFE